MEEITTIQLLPCILINASPPASILHIVALALGSNLGDRFANIETALRFLEVPSALLGVDEATVSVIDTSFMYETGPMLHVCRGPAVLC